jgi:hypothetical protein
VFGLLGGGPCEEVEDDRDGNEWDDAEEDGDRGNVGEETGVRWTTVPGMYFGFFDLVFSRHREVMCEVWSEQAEFCREQGEEETGEAGDERDPEAFRLGAGARMADVAKNAYAASLGARLIRSAWLDIVVGWCSGE